VCPSAIEYLHFQIAAAHFRQTQDAQDGA